MNGGLYSAICAQSKYCKPSTAESGGSDKAQTPEHDATAPRRKPPCGSQAVAKISE